MTPPPRQRGTPPPDWVSPRREVRRRHRPGHHQHPVRGRRPLWSDRGHRSAGARTDLPDRVGWSTMLLRSGGVTQAVVAGGLAAAGQSRKTLPPSGSPIGADDGGVGPHHRNSASARDRVAGHPHRRTGCRALRGGGADRFRGRFGGLPLATYFSRTQSALAARTQSSGPQCHR